MNKILFPYNQSIIYVELIFSYAFSLLKFFFNQKIKKVIHFLYMHKKYSGQKISRHFGIKLIDIFVNMWWKLIWKEKWQFQLYILFLRQKFKNYNFYYLLCFNHDNTDRTKKTHDNIFTYKTIWTWRKIFIYIENHWIGHLFVKYFCCCKYNLF